MGDAMTTFGVVCIVWVLAFVFAVSHVTVPRRNDEPSIIAPARERVDRGREMRPEPRPSPEEAS